MSNQLAWKLKLPDGSLDHFIDIRRKVGNRLLRAYLLDQIRNQGKLDTLKGSLRGPKDEFKDFSKFIILRAKENGEFFRFLIEAGVYENIRIVGTDSKIVAEKVSEDILALFTDTMQNPEKWDSHIIVSPDSRIRKA